MLPCPSIVWKCYFAGCAGAGAGSGAGAGAGCSCAGAGAGSSGFLQPIVSAKAAINNMENNNAISFFIVYSPPSKIISQVIKSCKLTHLISYPH